MYGLYIVLQSPVICLGLTYSTVQKSQATVDSLDFGPKMFVLMIYDSSKERKDT